MNLELWSRKKRYAQAQYYNNQGRSPLTRPTGAITAKENGRQPVHQRLGNKGRITLRRMLPNNLTDNRVPFRNKKLLRRNFGGTPGTPVFRRNNLNRARSAQLRLHKIRQQNGADIAMQMGQSPSQRIKLRRRQPFTQPGQATDFTVQVYNPASYRNPNLRPNYLKHSVHASVDAQLQSEIQRMQNQTQHSPEIIEELPIFAPGFGVTNIFLNDRFSSLP